VDSEGDRHADSRTIEDILRRGADRARHTQHRDRPTQAMGAGQSKSRAVVTLPPDARESAQALRPALPGSGSAERAGWQSSSL
jgi:hypothetical protein